MTVTAADLQLVGDDNFQVTAEVGGAGGSIISRTFQVGIQRPPQASFSFQRAGLVVTFTDTSSGSPTSWQWDFGDGTPISNQQNPVHSYSDAGTYRRHAVGAQQHRDQLRQQPGSDHQLGSRALPARAG